MLMMDEGASCADNAALADVTDALETVRRHLGMEYSYLSEFQGDEIVFRAVSSTKCKDLVGPGDRMPSDATYCFKVAHGRLPALIQDTADYPITETIPATTEIPIRSHVSVPIHRSNGELFGMFCCFSGEPKPSLNERDLGIVTMFAELSARSLNAQLDRDAAQREMRQQIINIIKNKILDIHLQPIVSLRSGKVKAVEALSRFRQPSENGVEWWFQQAQRAMMEEELEITAIGTALTHLPKLPDDVFMTVNVSPTTLSSPQFMEVLRGVPGERLIVELTEHVEIGATHALLSRLDELRHRKVGIAIDDVGAGYAGLSTIIEMRPDILKLDRSLVTDIHKDPAKQSLTRALLDFAAGVDAFLIAEGVETEEENSTLTRLGARLGQGYLYGRPAAAEKQIEMIKNWNSATDSPASSVRPDRASPSAPL